jgi:oligosaccharide repeat unit polymerase
MDIVAVACFVLVFFLALSFTRKDTDVFSPARIFAIIWVGSIGLAELKLSAFQHIWSFYSWVVLALGIVSFLVGIFVVATGFADARLLSLRQIRSRLLDEGRAAIDQTRFLWTIIILFSAYLVAFAIEVAVEGTVPLLSPRPDLLRVTFGIFGFHLVVDGMMGIVLLSAEFLLVVPAKRAHKSIVALVIVVSIATFFTLLQRYTFFVVAVIAVAMIYYTRSYLRLRVIVPSFSAFLVVLFYINQIRSARYLRDYIYLTSKMKFPKEYWMFAEPYMYITMNLENFTRAVDRLEHHFFGYFTFDWALALTGLKHWLESYYNIVRLPSLISGYNTFAFHWWYYYDFGAIGVALFPFITGVVVGLLYYKLRTHPNLLTMMMYAIGVLVMVVSFIMNPLMRLDFVSNIVLIWLVHRYVIYQRTGPSHVQVRNSDAPGE